MHNFVGWLFVGMAGPAPIIAIVNVSLGNTTMGLFWMGYAIVFALLGIGLLALTNKR